MGDAPPSRPALTATRAAFFVCGLGTASWAPLVPYAKARLGIDSGALGLLLLCLGLGSIVTMPASGALAARFGCRRVICGAGLVVSASLPLLATVSDLPAMAACLFAFGAGFGAFGVAVNLQAVLVEQAARRALMSGFHAMFSIGGLAGAGGITTLLWTGLPPILAAASASAIVLALLAAFGRHLLSEGGDRGAPMLALPRGPVLAIGALCFVVFLAEGAMLDWSAVLMTSLHGVSPARAGVGYAAFAIAMAAGRLSGDRLVRALSGMRIVALGGCLAASGLAMAVLAPSSLAALLGFALVGLGCSNIVPVFYTSVGRQSVMPPNLAVAAVGTMGFSGILIGPAVIGLVAQLTSLPAAFLGVACMLLVVAASRRVVARSGPRAPVDPVLPL